MFYTLYAPIPVSDFSFPKQKFRMTNKKRCEIQQCKHFVPLPRKSMVNGPGNKDVVNFWCDIPDSIPSLIKEWSKLDCMQLKKSEFSIFFTDVEALEGYADALTEVGGLTPEHHQAIATKLALDLMEDLNIDEKQKSDLLEKETAFIKDAEIAYVRSKYILITAIVVDCVTTIYRAQLQIWSVFHVAFHFWELTHNVKEN